jgi:hypothetical protein
MTIINNKVIEDVDISGTIKNNKQTIKGHYNNKPINIQRTLKSKPYSFMIHNITHQPHSNKTLRKKKKKKMKSVK